VKSDISQVRNFAWHFTALGWSCIWNQHV